MAERQELPRGTAPTVDKTVELFRLYAETIDSRRYHEAVEPSRRLRDLGFAITRRPLSRRERGTR